MSAVQVPYRFFESGAIILREDGTPIFNPAYTFILFRGGRGRGGSWTMVTIAVVMMMMEPMDVLVVRKTSAKIKESVWKLIYSTAKRLGVEQHFKMTKTCIAVSNGSRVTYDYMKGNEIGIRSKEGIRLTLGEECADWAKSEIEALIPTIMRSDDSQFIGCFNQENEDDPIETMIMADPDCLTVNCTIDENPFAPEKLRREAEKMRLYDPESAAHVYGLSYNKKSNVQILGGKCVQEYIDPSRGGEKYYGLDWGTVDPTVFVVASLEGDDILIHEAIFMKSKDPNEVSDILLEYQKTHKIENYIYADSASAGSGSIILKAGLPVKKKWGKHTIDDGIRWLRSHRRIVVNTGLDEMWEETQKYRWKVDTRTQEILTIPASGYDHGIDALRYAFHTHIKKGII